MPDIVERLKSPEVFLDQGGMVSLVAYDAADEITSLREENARLREALEPFAKAADNVAPDDGSIGGCLCAPILLRSEIFAARDAITKASAVNHRDEGAPTI
jgi:hypothetical protein